MTKTKDQAGVVPHPPPYPEDLSLGVPAPEPLASELALREQQLQALRGAMTLICWAGVCEALPEAQKWFDQEGCLL